MKALLFNPFERYNAGPLSFAGVLAAIAGGIFAVYCNARYDGVIDMHFMPLETWKPFADNAIVIITLGALLYAIGRKINQKTRAVDILAAVLIARIPMYPLPFFNVNGMMEKAGHELMQAYVSQQPAGTSPMVPIVVFALFLFIALVWSMALLYNGFRTAANAKAKNHIIWFIGAVLLSEIISKSVIYLINQ